MECLSEILQDTAKVYLRPKHVFKGSSFSVKNQIGSKDIGILRLHFCGINMIIMVASPRVSRRERDINRERLSLVPPIRRQPVDSLERSLPNSETVTGRATAVSTAFEKVIRFRTRLTTPSGNCISDVRFIGNSIQDAANAVRSGAIEEERTDNSPGKIDRCNFSSTRGSFRDPKFLRRYSIPDLRVSLGSPTSRTTRLGNLVASFLAIEGAAMLHRTLP